MDKIQSMDTMSVRYTDMLDSERMGERNYIIDTRSVPFAVWEL